MPPTTSDVRPEDLPRGFADNHELRLGYLRWRIEFGDEAARATLEREERDGFSTLMWDPEDGALYDMGLEHYREFICSLRTGLELLSEQTMVLDGAPGTVEVVTRHMNGVQMRWHASS